MFRKLSAVFLIGLALGGLADHYYRPALKLFGLKKHRVHDAEQKQPVVAACPDTRSERVAVLLIAGQSNAANYGRGNKVDDDPRVLNFYSGKCFIARDPLLGATGERQSPWPRAAQKLLVRFDKVVIVTTAIGGTGITKWVDGDIHQRLVDKIVEAKRAGLSPTHFLWHQGENDANVKTSPAFYASALRSIIADVRLAAENDIPAFIALATRCQERLANDPIRMAQQTVADDVPRTFIAIDSDKIGFADRFDGCHMTNTGLEKMADGYAEAILDEMRHRP